MKNILLAFILILSFKTKAAELECINNGFRRASLKINANLIEVGDTNADFSSLEAALKKELNTKPHPSHISSVKVRFLPNEARCEAKDILTNCEADSGRLALIIEVYRLDPEVGFTPSNPIIVESTYSHLKFGMKRFVYPKTPTGPIAPDEIDASLQLQTLIRGAKVKIVLTPIFHLIGPIGQSEGSSFCVQK